MPTKHALGNLAAYPQSTVYSCITLCASGLFSLLNSNIWEAWTVLASHPQWVSSRCIYGRKERGRARGPSHFPRKQNILIMKERKTCYREENVSWLQRVMRHSIAILECFHWSQNERIWMFREYEGGWATENFEITSAIAPQGSRMVYALLHCRHLLEITEYIQICLDILNLDILQILYVVWNLVFIFSCLYPRLLR